MTIAIFLDTLSKLRSLGFVKTDQDYARLLGRNSQWVGGLRRKDGNAPRQVRQATMMRLRTRLLAWKVGSPRPVADALSDMVAKIDDAEAMARWLAR